MKRLPLAIIFTLSMMVSFGQVPDTLMKPDINTQIEEALKKKGQQLIVADGEIRLFANIKNGKVVSFYATDLAGKELKVSRSRDGPTGPDLGPCWVCVLKDHMVVCYPISNCSKIPKPTKVGG